MQLKVSVYVFVGLIFLSDILPGAKATLNGWSIRNKRAATSAKPMKRCLSPCMIFHTWCKNDGKCREKGEDCTWYCECPDNCEGFFCERVVPDGMVDPPAGQTEVKVVIQKEEKKEASSFDKSKLAKALAGIIMKKQTREEDKGIVPPESISRIDNKTQISVTKNVTATVLLNCPPDVAAKGKVAEKSNCNCTTDADAANALSPSPNGPQATSTVSTLIPGETPVRNANEITPVSTSTEPTSPLTTTDKTTVKTTTATENNVKAVSTISSDATTAKEQTIGMDPNASGLLEIIEKAIETVPISPNAAVPVETTTTVQPSTSVSSSTQPASASLEISTNRHNENGKVKTTRVPNGYDSTTKDISISGHKDQVVEGNELYSARSTIKVTTTASADHASVLGGSQMSVDQASTKNDSGHSTQASTANPGQSFSGSKIVDQETATTISQSSTTKSEGKTANSKVNMKTVEETSEPVIQIKSINEPKSKGPALEVTESMTTPHKVYTSSSTVIPVTKAEAPHVNHNAKIPPEGSGFPPENYDIQTVMPTTMEFSTTTYAITTTASLETVTPSAQKSGSDQTARTQTVNTSQYSTTETVSGTVKAKSTTILTSPRPAGSTTTEYNKSTDGLETPTTVMSTVPTMSTETLTTKETSGVHSSSSTASIPSTSVPTTVSITNSTVPTTTTASSDGTASKASQGSESTSEAPTTMETAVVKESTSSRVSVTQSSSSTSGKHSKATTEVLLTTPTPSTTTFVASTAAHKPEVIEKIVPIVSRRSDMNGNSDNKPGGDVDDMTLVSKKLPEIQRDINISELKPELLDGSLLQNQDLNNVL